MSRRIWKYVLQGGTVDMPDGAKALSVGVQDDAIVLWALVDPSTRMVPRRFRIIGTGHHIPEHQAIGVLDGADVIAQGHVHIFEERP